MSNGDFDVVRRGIAAFNGGDVETLIQLSHPDVCMVPVRALLEGSEYRGHEGVRRYVADMDEDWSEREVIADEMREVGERILVLGSFRAVGRASGTEVQQPIAWVAEVRDARLARLHAYTDPEAALRETAAD